MRTKGAREQLGLDVGPRAALIHRLAREEIARLARGQIDADDRAQDCACEIHGRRLHPPSGSPVEAWLRLFIRHRVQQEVARLARRAAAPVVGAGGPSVRADEADSVRQDWPASTRQFSLVASRLPEDVRAVVVLLAHQVAIPEIARVLALPLPVVRGRARRAGWVLHQPDAGSRPPKKFGPLTLQDFVMAKRREHWADAEIAHASRIRPEHVRKLAQRAREGRSKPS